MNTHAQKVHAEQAKAEQARAEQREQERVEAYIADLVVERRDAVRYAASRVGSLQTAAAKRRVEAVEAELKRVGG